MFKDALRPAQAVDFNEAIKFVNKIKARFTQVTTNCPETTNSGHRPPLPPPANRCRETTNSGHRPPLPPPANRCPKAAGGSSSWCPKCKGQGSAFALCFSYLAAKTALCFSYLRG